MTDARQIRRIREKVSSQGRRLNRCLPLSDIEAFERMHGIVLPDAYRDFLLEVGNGGVGPPDYGLMSLGEIPRDLSVHERSSLADVSRLARPFPFTKPWIWETGETSDEGVRADVQVGTLCLGTDGCAIYWHLVVTGPDRGFVWFLCGEGIQPTAPKRDFLRWYEDWLDGVDDWWK